MTLSGKHVLVLALVWGVSSGPLAAQAPPPPRPGKATGRVAVAPRPARLKLDPSLLSPLEWRNIGPTSMGGRIVDLAVVESHPATFWVASASGGLFKTTNNGITFEPQFQKQRCLSIGDVCVSPSDPNVVWVGTGEHNARNSVSWGDGVYKSTDGGRTWKHMGLTESFQIGRIAIHPTNPDVVYVGALGRLWGENEQRGLFKTTDGGKTWSKVLYVDDRTGVIDIAMHPRDPQRLIVATYERKRDPFDGGDPVKRFGPGSGLHRTTDGGRTWKKLTRGLPTVKLGRIGVTYSRSNPNNVFAVVESERIGQAPPGSVLPAYMGIIGTSAGGARLTQVTRGGPADKAGLKAGDVITEIGGKPVKNYQQLVNQIRAHKAGDTVELKAKRGGRTITAKLTFGRRGGRSNRPFSGRLGGQRENLQRQQGPEGFQTGGVFKSTDGGETWQRINSLNPRPFYYSQIRVDPSDERYVYVLGISAYRSTDGGRSFQSNAARRLHSDHHTLWIDPRDGRHMLLGCDGGLNITYDRAARWEFLNNIPIGQFYDVGVDTRTPYRIYGGMQDNGSWGGPSRTRSSVGPTAAEWYAIGGGDGFVCRADPEDPDVVFYESQYGNMARVNVQTGERARIRPLRNARSRFNWKTPFLLSHHNSRIFYCAGNRVFKSLNRGEKLRPISPEVTRTKKGTSTALAESPRDPAVLYVGTDDGRLWITRDGGRKWDRLEIPGRAGNRRVNSIEPSRYSNGRCYVVLDGHYFDHDGPDVWLTEDFGRTWKPLHASLPPRENTRVLREDVENPDLLYLGTEFGIYASIDRGRNWTKINRNMPNVAVHEIAVHPTAGEIVAGTHGRGIWILDVMPLRQLTRSLLQREDAALLEPSIAVQWHGVTGRRYYGSKRFLGENPDYGAAVYYALKSKPRRATVTVSDVMGRTIAVLRGGTNVGLNRVVWNLRSRPQRNARNQRQLRRLSPAQRRRYLATFGARVRPGTYLVTLDVDGKRFQRSLRVAGDPEHPTDSFTYEETEALRKLLKQTDD